MARTPKPWWWEARRAWYVTINGTRHRLAAKKREATKRFHELMANPTKPASEGLAPALDAFLDWTHENRRASTHERYRSFLQSFLDFIDDIPITDVKPFIVQQWCESHDWNQTTQSGAIRSLRRALNWAEQMGYCDRNPIARMPAPKPLRRTGTITPTEFNQLLEHIKDNNFADLLTVSYDSGARPHEIRRLEARHVQLANHRAVYHASEAKTNDTTVIYFPTERSMAVIKRLMEDHPTGAIFRNSIGSPWTRLAVKCRFANLKKKAGKGFRHYDFRRTWITPKIVSGVDSHVVAKLANHKSTAMIDKHYSVVTEDNDFMRNAARRGEDVSSEE